MLKLLILIYVPVDQLDGQRVHDCVPHHGEVLLGGLPFQADQEHLDEVPPQPLLAWDHLLTGIHLATLLTDEDCHGGQLEALVHGAQPHAGLYYMTYGCQSYLIINFKLILFFILF